MNKTLMRVSLLQHHIPLVIINPLELLVRAIPFGPSRRLGTYDVNRFIRFVVKSSSARAEPSTSRLPSLCERAWASVRHPAFP